jgi:hypothetical protein
MEVFWNGNNTSKWNSQTNKKIRAEKSGGMFATVRMKFCPSYLIPTYINAKTRTQIIIRRFFNGFVTLFLAYGGGHRVRVLDNRVLRNTFGPKDKKHSRDN